MCLWKVFLKHIDVCVSLCESVANQEENVLVHHFLELSAKRFPDKVALIHGDVRATYEEINTKADALARWLLDHGVSSGDRIVLLLENSLEYVVSYYGVLKAGAVAVPLSTDLKPEGLRLLLMELESKVFISSSKFERVLQATDRSSIQNLKFIIKNYAKNLSGQALNITEFDDVLSFCTGLDASLEIDEDNLASIIYTSGSTGQPKGVMLSHKNIVSNTKAICEYLHLTENDIQMVVLPFFYVMGKSLLNTHFAIGGTVVINNKFAFPAAVLKEMEEEKVTGFSGVPSTYAYLLHRSPLASYRDRLPALRYCSQAGGHMSCRIKEQLRQVLPEHTEIYIMYGATEASARLSYLEPGRFSEKMASIGRAIPGVTLQVLNGDGKPAPVGEIGEIVASGPNIMQGYWKDPEETARVLDANGYHTGDFGYQDQEGFFYIEGRKDSLLKVGGHRINPQEIEDVILRSDLVIEAAVLGIPDSLLGHRLVGAVAPRNGDCEPRRILSFCAGNLPKYKVPSSISIFRALPKSGSGKIDRNKCLQMLTTQEEELKGRRREDCGRWKTQR